MAKLLTNQTAAALQRMMRRSDIVGRVPIGPVYWDQLPAAYLPWSLWQIAPGSATGTVTIGYGALTRGGVVYTCGRSGDLTLTADDQVLAWKFDPTTNLLSVDTNIYTLTSLPAASNGFDYGPLYAFKMYGGNPILSVDFIRGMAWPALYS